MRNQTKRLITAAVLSLFATTAPSPAAAPPAQRPNVLMFVVDDLNTSLGCYGNPVVQTPNIDRLAQRGVVFQRAYCQFPVCNPSRTSLFTGLVPDHTGVMNNGTHYVPAANEAPLLPRYFHDHGYRTLRIGKVFHDSRWMLSGKPLRTTDDPAAWDLSEDEPLADDHDEDVEVKQRSTPAEKPTVSFAKL
ncbi:MAG: sulfatase-like hydrolase/transferase, partial [Bacillota bacterium]